MHGSSRQKPHRRVSWCCPFTVPPRSPENPTYSHHPPKSITSFSNSPQSSKISLVNRRRILSPGRVSPIDESVFVPSPNTAPVPSRSPAHQKKAESSSNSDNEGSLGIFDVRLNLKGKNGVSLVLELNSEVLSENSSVFADLIVDYRKGTSCSSSKLCRIEVSEVENLNVFRETIELMFEENITKRLFKIGVYRAIDILEKKYQAAKHGIQQIRNVSAGITFGNGVSSCLKYLEAMPWTEEEEEKMRNLFTKYKFDNSISKDILSRLYFLNNDDSSHSQQNILSKQLVSSVTKCANPNAKNELKPLVKTLLCRTRAFNEDIYIVCKSCIQTLVSLFQDLPLIERISKEVDNINWLIEVLIDRQVAEEFVVLWADQEELIRLHGATSAMVRYEVSRITGVLLIAMGSRKMHCQSDVRVKLLEAWFGPLLKDFGWLRRCRKGLDVKVLEETMGQILLTLPLKHQYDVFMEWFSYFSKYGTECPNLSRSFQIWWRRSFLKGGSESHSADSR